MPVANVEKKDVNKIDALLDEVRHKTGMAEVRPIMKKFVENSSLGKEPVSIIGGATAVLYKEGKWALVPELTRAISERNEKLRAEIDKEKGIEGGTTRIYQDVGDFVKEFMLTPNPHKFNEGLEKLKGGGFTTENMAELMKKLVISATDKEKKIDIAELEERIRTVNAVLASEGGDLKYALGCEKTRKELMGHKSS
jgi:hypothetical protein